MVYEYNFKINQFCSLIMANCYLYFKLLYLNIFFLQKIHN